MNRLQFLRGNYRSEPPLRPPWSQTEQLFTELCDRCDECIEACPSKVIRRGEAGFPTMDFSRGGCDFCQQCAQACPVGAIQINHDNVSSPWSAMAEITSRCFSERGVVCRSCGEVCEMRAIRFRLAVGGVALIELNQRDCNGCGECVSICPAAAIQVKSIPVKENAEARL